MIMTNDNDGWTPIDIDREIGKYAGDIEREIRSDTGAALVRLYDAFNGPGPDTPYEAQFLLKTADMVEKEPDMACQYWSLHIAHMLIPFISYPTH